MSKPSKSNSLVSTPPARAVAGSLGLAGFTVAIISGLKAGNEMDVIVMHAVIGMLLCVLVGGIVGRFCDSAVSSYLADYVTEHPIPDSNLQLEDIALQLRTKREQLNSQTEKNEFENENSA